MKILTIEHKPKDEMQKTRKFSAQMVSYLTADMLWGNGSSGPDNEARPVYVTLAGSEAALRPFLANFVTKGKKAKMHPSSYWTKYMRCLKSVGYDTVWQRNADRDTHLVTIYLRQMFEVDPGMIDHERCEFLSAPPIWWTLEQRKSLSDDDVQAVLDHMTRLHVFDDVESPVIPKEIVLDPKLVDNFIPRMAHFAMCLDKRTRRPLINSLAFCAQLYIASLSSGLASVSSRSTLSQWGNHKWVSGFEEYETVRAGLARATIMYTSHDILDNFLTSQVRIYQQAGGHYG